MTVDPPGRNAGCLNRKSMKKPGKINDEMTPQVKQLDFEPKVQVRKSIEINIERTIKIAIAARMIFCQLTVDFFDFFFA